MERIVFSDVRMHDERIAGFDFPARGSLDVSFALTGICSVERIADFHFSARGSLDVSFELTRICSVVQKG